MEQKVSTKINILIQRLCINIIITGDEMTEKIHIIIYI